MNARKILVGCSVAVVLAGCGGSGSPAPEGWSPIAGSQQSWSSGPGAASQRYSLEKKSFAGTLQDLASQEVVDVAMRYKGAKFTGSDVFLPCPGIAAVATFSLERNTMERAFSVQNGEAVMITYLRPAGAAENGAAMDAMQRTLCVMP